MASTSEEILYVYKDKVYLNITNKCPCACTFCIRSKKDAIGDLLTSGSITIRALRRSKKQLTHLTSAATTK